MSDKASLEIKRVNGSRVSHGIIGLGLLVGMYNGPVSAATSQLISQQASVVAESIKEEAVVCAAGETEGTIGHSINEALAIHTELASATPNVESLFSVNSNCFGGLSGMFDLSFAIPSLSSILGAAAQAVVKYAQKKVCTVVSEVSGMVTTPINQAIRQVGGRASLGDLNGLSNGLLRGGLSQLDPSLGSSYHGAPAGGQYNVDLNPFNQAQTDFGGNSAVPVDDQGAPFTPSVQSVPSSIPEASSGDGSPSSGGATDSQDSSFSTRAGSLFN